MKLSTTVLLMAAMGCAGTSQSDPSRTADTVGSNTSGDEERSSALAQGDLPACCAACPLALSGVTLKYAQATGGASMIFNAPDKELDDLRARVRELAAYHNRNQQKLAMMTMPHDAQAVAIDGGAQLLLTTHAVNDVPALQTEVENEVQWMLGGRCPGNEEQKGCSCQLEKAPPLSSAPESETTPPRE